MHEQNQTRLLKWEHGIFDGRRVGSPEDVGTSLEMLRNWGVTYAPFLSSEDAQFLTNVLPGMACEIRIRGSLVDRFYWDDKTRFTDHLDALDAAGLSPELQSHLNALRSEAGIPEYVQANRNVIAALTWYLTGNPTESEMERVDGGAERMGRIRRLMAGAVLFPGTPAEFTVTELPEERAE
jgi:hypothetical protein